MLTLKQIRNDLKNIRYYYSRKEAFEQGFRVVGTNDIVCLLYTSPSPRDS